MSARAAAVLGLGAPVARLAAVLALWQALVGLHAVNGLVLPSPAQIVVQVWSGRQGYLLDARTTLGEAGLGFLAGSGLAVASAILFLRVRVAERALMPLAVASYCLPAIAIAPILQVVLPGDEPKVVLAALFVFFTTLTTVATGLRSVDPVVIDMVRAFGGTGSSELRKVRVRNALPYLVRALQLGAPSALLGAIIGEFLGGSSGLGIALIQAEADLSSPRTWAVLAVSGAISGVLYGALGLASHRLERYGEDRASSGPVWPSGEGRSGAGRSRWARKLVSATVAISASVAVTLGVWTAAIKMLRLSSYFAVDPAGVWSYLFSGSQAGEDRSLVFGQLGVTLEDAALGFVSGLVVASALAAVMVMIPRVSKEVMPWAVALRSVPLVAIAPLISVELGRGIASVLAICAIVTFFPTLVFMVGGLRGAPAAALDLLRACGGRTWSEFTKVRAPTALPALFHSARVAAPGALLAAILIEWTATGNGMGAQMIVASETSQYPQLWSDVAVVTAVSLLLYAGLGILERYVTERRAGRVRPS